MAGDSRAIETRTLVRFSRGSLHWIIAAAVVAVLLTAVPSVSLSALRPGQSEWLYWHIAGGWAIVTATVIRFGRYAIVGDGPSARQGAASILMLLMLVVLAAVIVAGLLAFRNPPLRAPLRVLGLFEAPVLFRENHALHWTAVLTHRWLSYLLVGLLAMHAPVGLLSLSRRLRSTSIQR